MLRPTIGTLLGLAVALLVALRLGGALGAGVLWGFVVGAALAGFGLAWQLHVGRTRPERLFHAVVASFLAKLACLLCATLVLRGLDPEAVYADHRSFLVAFGVAVVSLGLWSAPEAVRVLGLSSAGASGLREGGKA